jgi:FdhD protein
MLAAMPGPRRIVRVDAASGERWPDRDALAEEAPLEIRARDQVVATVLRTPGHDLELVRGLIHAEGAAPGERPALVQTGGDVVDVDLPAERFAPRALAATAACGMCGRAAIDDLARMAAPVPSDLVVPAALIAGLPARLAGAQPIFEATGGLHAAALFDETGQLIAVREDVGRHNALDKVVGWAIEDGRLPLARSLILVSGRLGYELAHKAVMAGAPILAAVSAPSTLAVDVCERFRVAACGFVRGGRFNVYSHAWRVDDRA